MHSTNTCAVSLVQPLTDETRPSLHIVLQSLNAVLQPIRRKIIENCFHPVHVSCDILRTDVRVPRVVSSSHSRTCAASIVKHVLQVAEVDGRLIHRSCDAGACFLQPFCNDDITLLRGTVLPGHTLCKAFCIYSATPGGAGCTAASSDAKELFTGYSRLVL